MFVTGDQILLRQLLSNLLINAIKYSAPNAAISVSIGINNGHCEFTVTNQSEHLNKEDRDHFSKLLRHLSAKSNAEGAGFGLNVANEIAKITQGSIQPARHRRISSALRFSYRCSPPTQKLNLHITTMNPFPTICFAFHFRSPWVEQPFAGKQFDAITQRCTTS